MSYNIIPINKYEIDEKNPFIKDTFFEKSKISEVGSGNDTIGLELDDFFTFKFISGKYDLNASLDRCIVDNEKIIVMYTIHMYRSGLDYEKLFDLIKENKYCYIFLETALKDNPYTKEIIDHLLNIYDKDTYQPIVDCNDYSPLIFACEKNMNEVALKLIDKFGGLCKPEQVSIYGETALILACFKKMNEVALKIIDTFGEICKPDHVNKNCDTALIFACYNNMNDVALKLIDKFGELCIPEQSNQYGSFKTPLIWACINKMNEVALKIIDKFGKDCKPDYVNGGYTALIIACHFNMNDVALKLIDTFGELCKPEQVTKDGKTALLYTIENNMNEVALKLIDKFGIQCNPEQIDKDSKTALHYASENNMNEVVSNLKTLLDL